MAEPFNAEQYRQQMGAQTPQTPPPAMGHQPQMMQNMAAPQPYQPHNYQPHPQQIQPQIAQPMPQHYTPHPMPQPQAVQTEPSQIPPIQQGQPQAWVPQGQPQQMQNVQMMQPQTPVHHMPPPPVFAPPPGPIESDVEVSTKKSRFSLTRSLKAKQPKTPKVKKTQGDNPEKAQTKTSPAMIFMFGMASGILCFLLGSMLMSGLVGDSSSKGFAEIERQNTPVQQSVLPTKPPETQSVTQNETP